MESIWSKNTHLAGKSSALRQYFGTSCGDRGGMAGILTAYLLKEKGIDAVVLEAQRVGSGQTRNTTAKSLHSMV